jgi:hypothetical protein
MGHLRSESVKVVCEGTCLESAGQWPSTESPRCCTVMWFSGLDAVRLLAGADYETAVVPPKARSLLSRFALTCNGIKGPWRLIQPQEMAFPTPDLNLPLFPARMEKLK